jgi:hypothetical protein
VRVLPAAALLALLFAAAPDARGQAPSWREVRAEFGEKYRDRDELTRVRAVLGLSRGAHPEAVGVLLGVLTRRPTPGVYAYATEALTRLGSRECLAEMRRAYGRSAPAARAAILLAVRARDDPELRALAAEALAEGGTLLRTAAVASLAHRTREGTEQAISAALGDPHWPVAAAALDRVAALGDRDLASGLPALLEAPASRLRESALEVLRALTGKDFGFDRELWERWLQDGREGAAEDSVYARPTYYGIRVVGDRPVFVLDISASMLEEIRGTPPVRRGPVTGEEAPGTRPRIDDSRIRTKLELAKAELAAALEGLPEDARFGLVFYSDSVSVWKDELIPATAKNVAAAVKRVRGLGAVGNTNVYDALLRALDLGGEGAALTADPEGPDQILFLTDGKANRGAIWHDGVIRTVFRTLYRLRRVRVDCVGVGDHDRKLLEGLARDARGHYVAVGE